MGRLRRLGKRIAERLARRAGQSDLFEKPGERPRQAPLSPSPAAAAARAAAPPPAEAPSPARSPAPSAARSPAPGPPPVAAPPRAPAPAPDPARGVEAGGPASARAVDLAGVRAALGAGGGVRLVNHWATWCIPCVEEFGLLRDLASRVQGRAAVLGVSWDLFDPRGDEDDIVEHVANFGAGHHLTWPSLVLGEAVEPEAFFSAFDLSFQQIPQTWLVADDGRVVLRVDGVLDEAAADRLLAALEGLGA
jgi:thiol-disulfide isomerase/thioredoxin